MIVLVYPMWSNQNVNADSNYIFLKNLLTKIVQHDKSFIFFVLFNKNLPYSDEGFFDGENIVKINVDLPISKRDMVMSCNVGMLRKISQKIPVDIVFNNVVEIGNAFKRCFQYRPDTNEIVVVNQHHYVIHPTLPEYVGLDYISIAQVANSILADINVFNSQHCQNMFHDQVKLYLSDKVRIEEKLIYMGVIDRKMLDFQQKKYEKPTFIYNHRLSNYKNWRKTFEIFDILSKKHDFQVIVTGGDRMNLKAVEDKPYVQIKAFKKHEDYLAELSKCHFNTLNSQHETFCISILESMMFGLTCVCPNSVTFPELLGIGNSYLFKKVEQQIEILDELLSHEPVFNKENQDRAFELFDDEIYAKKYIEIFNSFLPTHNPLDFIREKSKREKIRKYLNIATKINFEDFRKFVFDCGFSNQSFPERKIKVILNFANFKERWENNNVVFYKES